MKRLYNEYLAHTGAGNEIAQKVDEALRPIVDACIQEDYDLRDVESVIIRTASVMLSEVVLVRAMKKRKAERTAATPTTRMTRLIDALRELKDIVQLWGYDHDPEQDDLPSWKKVLDEAQYLLTERTLKERI